MTQADQVVVRQYEIEVILTRHLALYLAHPIFLMDVAGNLIFYNELAERVLGMAFETVGALPTAQWQALLHECQRPQGGVMPPPLPFDVVLVQQRLRLQDCCIEGADGVFYRSVVVFPLLGQGGRHLGAAMILWAGQR